MVDPLILALVFMGIYLLWFSIVGLPKTVTQFGVLVLTASLTSVGYSLANNESLVQVAFRFLGSGVGVIVAYFVIVLIRPPQKEKRKQKEE